QENGLPKGSGGARLRPQGQAGGAGQPQQGPAELLQAAVVGDGEVAVPRTEPYGPAGADAAVVHPDDEVHQPLPPARQQLLDAADAPGDLGVLQRLADQQAGVPPADLVADPVPEGAVGVPGAVGLGQPDPQPGGAVLRQAVAGGAGEPQVGQPGQEQAGGVLARPAVPGYQDAFAAAHLSPLPPALARSPSLGTGKTPPDAGANGGAGTEK